MPETGSVAAAYYRRTGPTSYTPTMHTQGAWAPDQQHMGPVSGLLTHVLERTDPRPDLFMSRVSFDILGVIPLDEVEVTAAVIRHGRTIELVEATLAVAGRPVVRAHAWRLQRSDTSAFAGTELRPIDGVDAAEPWPGSETWDGGFIASLDIRRLPESRPGRGQVWVHPTVDLIADEVAGCVPQLFSVIDTMNGVAVRIPPSQVAFPNTDLTVHLFREPAGARLGLDVEVSFGPSGAGVTSAVLHDDRGPFGRALQILTLRPRR